MTNRALIIFIKNPALGQVKTRLAKTMGNDKALAIYKALIRHTRTTALACTSNRLLFYSEYINQSDEWSAKDFRKYLQVEADLGIKMQEAFREAFRDHQKVVIIGSDCPSLTPEIVQAAFEQLEQHSFVIGPAMDGGYYLLGMNRFYPSVFDNIVWSTPTVLKATIERIKALQQSYSLLPTLSDIDYEEDWNAYGWEI